MAKRLKIILQSSLAVAVFGITAYTLTVMAGPPTRQYNPGETLNPSCAPNSLNCTIVTPVGSNRLIDTLFPLIGGGDLSNNRTLSIGGLTTFGLANQLVSVRSDGTGWEYRDLIGTTNRVSVSNSSGTIVLSTPQDIHSEAIPTFAGLRTVPSNLTRVGAVTLNTGENQARSVAVSGRYAYVVTWTSPARLAVIDVTNPNNPTRVGAVTLNTGENQARSVAVSGRYAYVVTQTTPTRVVVVDISNPSAPLRVGAVTLNAGEDAGQSISISGKYAYITTWTSPTRVVAIDISNPTNPTRVGAVTLNTGENVSRSISVLGTFAYVVLDTFPTQVVSINISNPANPIRVGSVTLAVGEDNGQHINVVGSYAYVLTHTSPAQLITIDISNPANLIRVGSVTLAPGEVQGRTVTVTGRYAYISVRTDPARLVVVDVSNPANPFRVNAITLNAGENQGRSVAISGGYAYVVTDTSPLSLVVIDLQGIETNAILAHALEAGNAQIRGSLNVVDAVTLGGSLNVGAGGIFSAGPLSVISGSTGTALSALDIRNSAGTSLMFILDNGNVGIGTSSPAGRILNIAATGAGAHPIATAWELHSDIAYKTDISDISYGLNDVLRLKPREFNMKIDSSPSIGFIAQELELVIPEVVSGQDGQKGVSYANLTAVLTKAIQEQQIQIEDLKDSLELLSKNQVFPKAPEGFSSEINTQGPIESFVEITKKSLSILGVFVENGIIRARELSVDRVTTETARIERLEMVDQATGEIYCTWIENGSWKKTKSSCDKVVAPAVMNNRSINNLDWLRF